MAAYARQLEVLVVDDDPGDVLLIEEALERTGQVRTVHVAGDGCAAVAFLRGTGVYAGSPRPDVVLLDLNMPRMNGREVLAEVKIDPLLGSIPILMFTTSQDPNDIIASYALHANAYVTKRSTSTASARSWARSASSSPRSWLCPPPAEGCQGRRGGNREDPGAGRAWRLSSQAQRLNPQSSTVDQAG